MTLNDLQRELLGVCKFCERFFDTGRKQKRYQCVSWKCSIFDAQECKRTYHVRKKMAGKRRNKNGQTQ